MNEKRRAIERDIALTKRRIAVLGRKIRALAKMEEGIGELEQVDREIAALERSFACAAELPGRGRRYRGLGTTGAAMSASWQPSPAHRASKSGSSICSGVPATRCRAL